MLCSRARKNDRGFTLLEVLVALAILALSAAAILRQTHLEVRQQYTLESKSTAFWIADNAMTQILSQSQWPPLGRLEDQQNYAGENWRVVTDVQETPDRMLRKIEISVTREQENGGQANSAHAIESSTAAQVTLTAYRGQY